MDSSKKIVVFGATSAIAQATLKLFAGEGYECCLVARNKEKLSIIEDDLKVSGAERVVSIDTDLADSKKHTELFTEIKTKFGDFGVALVAYGTLSDQKACEQSFEQTYNELNINLLSVISLLTIVANIFSEKKQGQIAVISSVAGDRGRQSNYVYGAAKGALTLYLQGLRNRLASANVSVLTIKPGFVDTPMTKEFTKGMLWVRPDFIAKGIYKAIIKQKDVVYLPWFWKWIMLVIKLIPEKIFKKLSL
ncbi:MAG: SDR family oxidoreductase [Gammaproteobacteria bacterium]